MLDVCLLRRNYVEEQHIFRVYMLLTCRYVLCCISITQLLLFYWFYYNFKVPIIVDDAGRSALKLTNKLSPRLTLARVLYLFLCENQAEMNTYSRILPSVTADVAFYCWRENCVSNSFSSSIDLYIAPWPSHGRRNEILIRLSPTTSLFRKTIFHHVRSRVFIINEHQLSLTVNMTWATSRNKLLELALAEEQNQGWRWAYLNFVDGDIHMTCPLAEQILTNKPIIDYGGVDELVFASYFRSLVKLSRAIEEYQCFLLFDTFLLSISPAIGVISGGYVPMMFTGLLTQIVYSIDAMLNAIHRDAVPFLLPYCARYDTRNWWISQAIFIYRSLCLYGHSIQFDGVRIKEQIHRPYPRNGSPWDIDGDMNLVPSHLIRLHNYSQYNHYVSPLVLHHYNGWSLALTSDLCRHGHTQMELGKCLVNGSVVNS